MSESPPLLKDGAYCTTSGRRNQEGWNIIFDSSISGFLSAGSGRWIVATYPPNAVSRASGRKRGAPRRRVLHGRVAVPLRPKMYTGGSQSSATGDGRGRAAVLCDRRCTREGRTCCDRRPRTQWSRRSATLPQRRLGATALPSRISRKCARGGIFATKSPND